MARMPSPSPSTDTQVDAHEHRLQNLEERTTEVSMLVAGQSVKLEYMSGDIDDLKTDIQELRTEMKESLTEGFESVGSRMESIVRPLVTKIESIDTRLNAIETTEGSRKVYVTLFKKSWPILGAAGGALMMKYGGLILSFIAGLFGG